MSIIFANAVGGTRQVTVTGSDIKFITITDPLKTVMDCWAPAQGVVISQKVDHSITKSLNSDFMVSTFGDQPVQIVLSGLCVYACTKGLDGKGAGNGLVDLYKTKKLSADVSANRLDIGIYDKPSGTAQTFTCALVGLDLEANARTFESQTCSYRLTLIGVEK